VAAVSERIDAAIDRLDDALRAAGLAGLEAPADTNALAEIDDAVAPYRLPRDLARFWERVDFPNIPVHGTSLASPLDPKWALETHRLNNRPEFANLFGPPLLFPIARICDHQWSIELASEWSEDGTVFSLDAEHEIEYPAFVDLVEVYGELVEEGAFEPSGPSLHVLLYDPERAKQQERFGDSWPHPLYGDVRQVSHDPAGWPAHWLAAAGIDPASRVPLGATHTIAELVQEAADGDAAGRVVGEVLWAGGSSEGVIVVIDDGATQLDVWCPSGASPWGPRVGERFEFELAVPKGAPSPASFSAQPLLEFIELVSKHGVSAVALDIRPVDD
jgi:hypothetical protein